MAYHAERYYRHRREVRARYTVCKSFNYSLGCRYPGCTALWERNPIQRTKTTWRRERNFCRVTLEIYARRPSRRRRARAWLMFGTRVRNSSISERRVKMRLSEPRALHTGLLRQVRRLSLLVLHELPLYGRQESWVCNLCTDTLFLSCIRRVFLAPARHNLCILYS